MDKAILRLIQDQAIKMLKETKGVLPALFIEGANGKAMVGITFVNDQQKYDLMLELGRKFAAMEPVSLTFVAEAWIAHTPPTVGKRVSDMPDRQECIAIMHERRPPNSYKMACYIPFARIGKQIVLGENVEASTDDGEVVRIENGTLQPFWLGVSNAWLEPRGTQAN